MNRENKHLLRMALSDLHRHAERLRPVMQKHQAQLWWLHSLYALLLGAGVMWLGTKDFRYLRVALFYLLFIWGSSLLLPWLIRLPNITPLWTRRLRLLINYFSKNFYQQMLFFILPVYAASTTWWSSNMIFVLLTGISAVLSTLDLVYDRYISVHWRLGTGFFAFNLFACFNVLLPSLWGVGTTWSVRGSAVLAILGFATLCYRLSSLDGRQRRAVILAGALLMLAVVELGRPLVPPVPLRLMKMETGTGFSARSRQIRKVLKELPSGFSGRIYGMTAIAGPAGFQEKVRHRWKLDGRVVFDSPCYQIRSGRVEGFRLFTSVQLNRIRPGQTLQLEALTEGGQLIGRLSLPPGISPGGSSPLPAR